MTDVVLGITAAVVVIKDFAYFWAACQFCWTGSRHAQEMRSGHLALKINAPVQMNPIDRGLDRVAHGSGAGVLLLVLFKTPVLVTLASLLIFCLGPDGNHLITLTLGTAIACCATLALIVAVLRRLILGSHDWETSDVQLPGFVSGWAVAKERGANNSVYFLILVYLSLVGFAALYFALAVAQPSAFINFGPHASVIKAVYFSITTLATVGYGDIGPVTDVARISVIAQISTGPLLLSWLLSALLTTSADTSE